MAKRKYVKENNLVKAINTDSLELQKPLVNEYYDINVHNSNMDKIDAGYRQNKNDISNINYELSKTEKGDIMRIKIRYNSLIVLTYILSGLMVVGQFFGVSSITSAAFALSFISVFLLWILKIRHLTLQETDATCFITARK